MSNIEDIKKEIRTLLGNKCSNPHNLKDCSSKFFVGGKLVPNRKYMFMIDHINGFGNKYRRECMTKNGNINWYKYYKLILEQIKNGSKEFQLLCCICEKHKRHLEVSELLECIRTKCIFKFEFYTKELSLDNVKRNYYDVYSDCKNCLSKDFCKFNRVNS
jgi:hypothetical protein